MTVTVTGSTQHQEAVRRLQASYAAIAPGSPVRLAKRTSNLFRPRDAIAVARARRLRPRRRDQRRRRGAHRRRAGHVHLRGPRRRDPAPRADPDGRAPAAHDHPGRRGHRPRHRVDLVPQRAARTSRCWRWTCSPAPARCITCTPDNEHADLFATFPNSYGSLGYATRLRIELEPVASHVALRHVRFTDTACPAGRDRLDHRDAASGTASASTPSTAPSSSRGSTTSPSAAGRTSSGPGSDYVGQQIYWRSIQQREIDLLTTYDYLWRWDTDWFWCSRAFGVQNPLVRRFWPRRFKRSDVYHKLVGLDLRFGIADRLDRRAGPAEARAGDPGRRGAGRAARRVPRLVRRGGRDAAGVAVPVAAAR